MEKRKPIIVDRVVPKNSKKEDVILSIKDSLSYDLKRELYLEVSKKGVNPASLTEEKGMIIGKVNFEKQDDGYRIKEVELKQWVLNLYG